ncbi:MAG: DUF1156 domain-containing protein [Acidobacteriota bacterium]|nr:DUF1156 domain-containing protein [Acidobacteriota bacterium]
MARKLIEVALPLKAINEASAREKSIRHGHPSTLHLWWARRPLAAARAVIFAQLVDDPSAHPELFPTEEDQHVERERLFRILEDLVEWENTTNEDVLQRARAEIEHSWRLTCAEHSDDPRAAELYNPDVLPAFHDPFAGGGAIPLEAQRLGLESYASDLNPVAVLINKAMIEIPPRFAGRPPVNPEARQRTTTGAYRGAQGLAEDVRYYGTLLRSLAYEKLAAYYPPIRVTPEMVENRPDLRPYQGQDLTVIAYLWARTVKSPDPAYHDVDVPLVASFALSTKAGKEVWVEPVIDEDRAGYHFEVRLGPVPEVAKRGTIERSAGGTCILSSAPMPFTYLRSEGRAGRMGDRLMAIVCEGARGRVYLSPTVEQERLARSAVPSWKPEMELPHNTRDFKTPLYGLTTYGDLFTPRQLLALTAFSDLLDEVREVVRKDAIAAGLPDDHSGLADGGSGSRAYAEAVTTYLGFVIDKCTDYLSSICTWISGGETMRNVFGRQAIPMVWDFAEANPFSDSSGNWNSMLGWVERVLQLLPASPLGHANQIDAQHQEWTSGKIVSTDPPYYDNIGYADLADFFYVWLRRNLGSTFPDLFTTLATPKAEELVATPYRHGSKEGAEKFFLAGMTEAMEQLATQAHHDLPLTIYYAFKQSETTSAEGTTSTGWETFLEAVVNAGLEVSGTWPMRTERTTRMVGLGTNALASSIVLVCRQRPASATSTTRREFVAQLQQELPQALVLLQEATIAPVDLQQSALGPGMAIYTSYREVLNSDGSRLAVREALALINETLDAVIAQQEGDFDPDTRWSISWFEQYGFDAGDFGVAETLSKAKNTSVAGVAASGIVHSLDGKVRLLRPAELSADWDPARDPRRSTWEALHHLIRVLSEGGEAKAAELVSALGSTATTARELAYRLYVVSERAGHASDALLYNGLVQSWTEIQIQVGSPTSASSQDQLF